MVLASKKTTVRVQPITSARLGNAVLRRTLRPRRETLFVVAVLVLMRWHRPVFRATTAVAVGAFRVKPTIIAATKIRAMRAKLAQAAKLLQWDRQKSHSVHQQQKNVRAIMVLQRQELIAHRITRKNVHRA